MSKATMALGVAFSVQLATIGSEANGQVWIRREPLPQQSTPQPTNIRIVEEARILGAMVGQGPIVSDFKYLNTLSLTRTVLWGDALGIQLGVVAPQSVYAESLVRLFEGLHLGFGVRAFEPSFATSHLLILPSTSYLNGLGLDLAVHGDFRFGSAFGLVVRNYFTVAPSSTASGYSFLDSGEVLFKYSLFPSLAVLAGLSGFIIPTTGSTTRSIGGSIGFQSTY